MSFFPPFLPLMQQAFAISTDFPVLDVFEQIRVEK